MPHSTNNLWDFHLVGSGPQSWTREGVRSRVRVDVEHNSGHGGSVKAGAWYTASWCDSAATSDLEVQA